MQIMHTPPMPPPLLAPRPTARPTRSGWTAVLLAAMGLAAIPFTAPAREVRVATFNIENGTDAVGSPKYEAIKAQLARIDADIVGFQELRSATFGAWSNLAAELDYDYAVIGGNNGARAGNLFNGYFSHFPILSSDDVLSPPDASEMARFPFRAVIEVPDAQNPLILWNLHHKSGGNNIDKFRRAIEAYRTGEDIDAYLAAHPTHVEYVVLGDMNDDIRDRQTVQLTSQPNGAPASYVLGSDITFPVAYATFPRDRYATAGNGLQHLPAYWEDSTTPITRPASGRQLDYLLLSPALMNSPLGLPQSEVYYSDMDLGGGLPKVGDPLPAGTSATASDHLPVFADIQMADFSAVLPTAGLTSIGEMGGPFEPEFTVYSITDTNAFETAWTVWADVDWLTLTADTVWVSPVTPLEVEVALNANAALLPPGYHQGIVSFWNETTDLLEIRTVSLTVRDFLHVGPAHGWVASGHPGGPFTPESIIYTVTNKSAGAHTFTALATENWVTVTPSSWTLQANESVTVTASLNAMGLPIGTYANTVTFSNQTTGLVQERPVSLAISGSLCDAVDACELTWTTGGDADWFYQSTHTADGVDAAQSGPITSSQSTWMETVVVGPVTIAFQWQVSSRTDYHTLALTDNGNWQAQISGEVPWARQSYEVATGIHTLRWTYATSSTSPSGSNAGWVDQITFDYLTVSPAGAWTPSGLPGGPFTPHSQSYVLTNSGSVALQWTAASNVTWLSAAPDAGELGPGESALVEVSLNDQTHALPSGIHAAGITFSNITSGDTLSRAVSLRIQDSLVITPSSYSFQYGFAGGPYPAPSNIFTVSNSGPVAVTWTLSYSADWVSTEPAGGTLEAGAAAEIVATYTAQADALPAGLAYTQLVISNETTHLSQLCWLYLILEEPLALTSSGGHFSGPVGGPFVPASATYILTNRSSVAQEWSASTPATWLTLAPASGSLPPNSSTQVIAALSPAADALPMGVYSSSVVFSNSTSGLDLPHAISLSVGIEFCDALEACALDWTLGGAAPWLYQTNTTYDGIDAAASGVISDSEESWMETEVTGPGTLTFWWKVSSESNWDFLELWVDGVHSNRISGEVDWQLQTVALPAGPHTLRWRYTKDSSFSSGEDRGWVDSVTWTLGHTALGVPIAWYQRFGLAPDSGQTWDDLDVQAAASGAPYWFQYGSGLDPTEPDDHFIIHSIHQEIGQPTHITWWGGTNGPAAPYVIEATTNLSAGPWTAIGSSPRVAGLNSWTNPVPAERMHHYRIQATLAPETAP